MYSLKNHHTFGLAATSVDFIEINSIAQLQAWNKDTQTKPFMLLGEGSNCVFVENYAGTVLAIRISGIERITLANGTQRVTVGAGENWHHFVCWCIDNQCYGLENLALIPGTVGASPIQNIGAYGVEVESFIDSVEVLNLCTNEIEVLTHEQCQFSYRDSIFKRSLANKVVVVAVNFVFPKQWQAVTSYGELQQLDTPTPEAIFNKVIAIRKQKLPNPAELGNSGSFFKNPVVSRTCYEMIAKNYESVPHFPVSERQVKIPAAWLIDQAGFKGQTRGGIQCHPLHALVLTNKQQGTGVELLDFAREIVQVVRKQFNVHLENEVRLIGETGLIEL